LSPELYLRRPPARNEQYRLDNMLKAAAERGVQVKIIVYKEVTQALTRKYLNPALPNYLHSLFPRTTDRLTLALSKLGLEVIMKSLEETEKTDPLIAPPITVSSWYTKHYLEGLHPNIAVIRHPDHLPDEQNISSSVVSAFKNFKLTAASASKLPGDALKAIYGVAGETILYWAHHEKLCVVDGKIAFMGGLDLCYGRWDTNQHSIADVHPGDINEIVFPGQDYNNSRVMDFQDVQHWQNNKLDRTQNSRMGWSDISLSLYGEVVEDLKEHFVQRWNFLFREKMESRDDPKYAKLVHTASPGGYLRPNEEEEGMREEVKHRFEDKMHRIEDRFHEHMHHTRTTQQDYYTPAPAAGPMTCQIVRSCARWSHGVPLEVGFLPILSGYY
jgi:phospholipase D1/2